jgi:biopolymer transport protein ExbD
MAFKPSKAKKHKNTAEGGLNMNSMMDMMTIILLFLLKSFSTQGALITPSEDLKLPESIRAERPTKQTTVAVSKGSIMVNDEPIAPATILDEPSNLIIPLSAKLTEIAMQAKDDEANFGIEFSHEVIIQGDATLSYEHFSKIIYTCGDSEFYNMRILSVSNPGRNN